MTMQELSLLARLAQASYAQLFGRMSRSDIETAVQREVGGFTVTQSQQFAAQQSVILQYNDDSAGSGGTGSSLSPTGNERIFACIA
ncbi:MAG: hypothetical protein H0X13_04670 [Ramlibacter sp.]|nr:hypothetical protein [Ramlibacter sp.]